MIFDTVLTIKILLYTHLNTSRVPGRLCTSKINQHIQVQCQACTYVLLYASLFILVHVQTHTQACNPKAALYIIIICVILGKLQYVPSTCSLIMSNTQNAGLLSPVCLHINLKLLKCTLLQRLYDMCRDTAVLYLVCFSFYNI